MTIKELNNIAEELEKERATFKYPNLQPATDVNSIITKISSGESLRKLDSTTLHEYAVILSHYSLYLSDQLNRLTAKRDWCEGTIKGIIGRRLNDVPGGYFPEKDCYIRANDEHAIELEKIRLATDTKIKAFSFIAQKIQILSETLQGFAKDKSYSRRSYESH